MKLVLSHVLIKKRNFSTHPVHNTCHDFTLYVTVMNFLRERWRRDSQFIFVFDLNLVLNLITRDCLRNCSISVRYQGVEQLTRR